jgi:hypothetical protein
MKPEATQLRQVYAQFPSLRVNADLRALETAATRVLGPEPAKALVRALADEDTYRSARTTALTPSSPASGAFTPHPGRRAVVAGLTTGGLLSAAVLARAGYQVDAFEQGDRSGSEFQLGLRQALDELASISPQLAQRFLELTYRAAPGPAQPAVLPDCDLSIGEHQVLERVLLDHLKHLPNVTLHRNQKLELVSADVEGRYGIAGVGTPDLVVVAERASASTRKALGIESRATSPRSSIIAGGVESSTGYRPFSAEPVEGLDPSSEEYLHALQAVLEETLRAEAALVTEQVPHRRPTLLALQQRMSSGAIAGSNVLGLGEFVGSGAGMASATVSHIERLKALVFELELGTDKGAALRKYEQGAIADSLELGRRGITEMYPDIDAEKVSDGYGRAVTEWLEGKNKDPLAALERLLEPVSEALRPIGQAAA